MGERSGSTVKLMTQEYKIVHYEKNGHDIFQEWLDKLRDLRGRNAIQKAIDRAEYGNFGDHKFCRDGVSELRIHVGAGYRVYYSVIGSVVVLLLCGGSKKTQDKDINKAIDYLNDFKERN